MAEGCPVHGVRNWVIGFSGQRVCYEPTVADYICPLHGHVNLIEKPRASKLVTDSKTRMTFEIHNGCGKLLQIDQAGYCGLPWVT